MSLLTPYAVFAHACAQSTRVETKDNRRPFFSFDAPTGFLQHLEDVALLQIGKIFDVIFFR